MARPLPERTSSCEALCRRIQQDRQHVVADFRGREKLLGVLHQLSHLRVLRLQCAYTAVELLEGLAALLLQLCLARRRKSASIKATTATCGGRSRRRTRPRPGVRAAAMQYGWGGAGRRIGTTGMGSGAAVRSPTGSIRRTAGPQILLRGLLGQATLRPRVSSASHNRRSSARRAAYDNLSM